MTNEKHGGPALHTSEPWHTGGNGTIIYDKDGWGVASATVFHGRQEPETSAENARRIVACVNAFAGVSVDFIEGLAQGLKITGMTLDKLLNNAKPDCDEVVTEANGERRPSNCRNRLQEEGKSHPRSGCAHCKTGGITGCPYEK